MIEAASHFLRRRVLLATALCGGVALAVGLGTYLRRPAPAPPSPVTQEELPEPPVIDPAGVDPAVTRAVAEARTAVSQSPRSADAWGRLGMILLAHDFRTEANACLTRAERLAPGEPRWPYFQGVALAFDDPEAATPKLRRAAELAGGAAEAPRLQLAEVLMAQGQLEEAASEFRDVLRQHPDHARAHLGLGRLAYERGDLRESLAHLRRSAGDTRTRKGSHVLLAEVYQRLGDAEAVRRELREVGSLPDDPAWPDPLYEEVTRLRTGKQASLARADQLIRQGRHEEAVAALEQALRDYPGTDWAWLMLGRAYLGKNDLPAAEQVLRKAVQAAPELVEAHFYLGVALNLQQDRRAATACFRQATALKPGFALAHYNLGQCLREQGDQAGAIEAFRTALACKPDYVPAHVNLGELLAQKGQTAEALVHLRHAVQLDPADSRARRLLEQAQNRTAAEHQP
jgi:tetratricopeptide (TPR) repeat protein